MCALGQGRVNVRSRGRRMLASRDAWAGGVPPDFLPGDGADPFDVGDQIAQARAAVEHPEHPDPQIAQERRALMLHAATEGDGADGVAPEIAPAGERPGERL